MCYLWLGGALEKAHGQRDRGMVQFLIELGDEKQHFMKPVQSIKDDRGTRKLLLRVGPFPLAYYINVALSSAIKTCHLEVELFLQDTSKLV